MGYTLRVGLTFTFPKYSFGLRKSTKRGGAKLTFLFMDGFVWSKRERYFLGLNSPSPKNLFGLKKGAKRRGAKLTFLFMDGFD